MNGDPLCVHISDDFHIFTPNLARPRPPSLILFSLDGRAFSHMNRRILLLLAALGCFILASYATLQFFMACMAVSSLVGVPSLSASLHHHALLSWLWLAIAFAAVLAFIASIFGLIRGRTPGPMP